MKRQRELFPYDFSKLKNNEAKLVIIYITIINPASNNERTFKK